MKDHPLDFQGLCVQWDMELLKSPIPLTGGLLHRMYRIETSTGVFAAKALNPGVMARPQAPGNYRRAETIARKAAENGVPALPALLWRGDIFCQTGEQYWMLFPWVEGRVLGEGKITPAHCEKIGGVLGGIHALFPPSANEPEEAPAPMADQWADFLRRGREVKACWTAPLSQLLNNLSRWTREANAAAPILAAQTVLSHGDMDPKNVLWRRGEPLVIDWEAAGPVSPLQELLDTALYWSANGRDEERFSAFLKGYLGVYRPQASPREIQAALACVLTGRLGWLSYNLSRSLGDAAAGPQEQQLGTGQVLLTLEELGELSAQLPQMGEIFKAAFA